MYLSLYPVIIWLRSSTYLSSVVTNSFNTFSLLQMQNKSKYEEEEKVGMLRLELEEVWCEEFSKDPERVYNSKYIEIDNHDVNRSNMFVYNPNPGMALSELFRPVASLGVHSESGQLDVFV